MITNNSPRFNTVSFDREKRELLGQEFLIELPFCNSLYEHKFK